MRWLNNIQEYLYEIIKGEGKVVPVPYCTVLLLLLLLLLLLF